FGSLFVMAASVFFRQFYNDKQRGKQQCQYRNQGCHLLLRLGYCCSLNGFNFIFKMARVQLRSTAAACYAARSIFCKKGNSMIMAVVALIAGLALLVWSADRFVDGAAATARYAGMPPLLIGMVIIGFG